MSKYYFTYEGDLYGTAKDNPRPQPYKGGWTEIEGADSPSSAHTIFLAAHPESFDYENFCGYDWMLTERQFRNARLAEIGINGYKCVERISLKVDILERGAVNVG